MKLVVYNEWQKEWFPLGPSSAVADTGLNRRHSRRCSARVKAQRASYSPSTHLGMNGGAENFFLRPPVGRSMEYGLSCSAQIRKMGEVRYSSLMKTFPQEAEELFVATERNAKLRYEGYKKLSEM